MKHLDTWLHYTKDFSYRCILDTGSTDGTWEKLQEYAKEDPNLIIEQKIFDPWIFCDARNYNLNMIPEDVEWCLSPDLDEWFSINVLEEMERVIEQNPVVHNIATTRLDIYSKDVFVGPPRHIPSNKIHRRHDYYWAQPIYEHLLFKRRDTEQEIEIYSEHIYLVHNQDFRKKERPELYLKMLTEEVERNPDNCWCLWFLVDYYFKKQDLPMLLKYAIPFIKFNNEKASPKYKEVKEFLRRVLKEPNISSEIRAELIELVL